MIDNFMTDHTFTLKTGRHKDAIFMYHEPYIGQVNEISHAVLAMLQEKGSHDFHSNKKIYICGSSFC